MEEMEKETFNEFDYSNIVPDAELISYLVRYCEAIYNELLKMISQEEIKNEKLKSEYKFYEYKKGYDTKFEVTIKLIILLVKIIINIWKQLMMVI